MDREITNKNAIQMYMHCGVCLQELPKGQSPQSFAQIECGWTPLGFQVWCKRHQANIVHVDFEGQKHPANTTITINA